MAKKQFAYVDFCQSCRKVMQGDEKIVYVEEGSSRFFCSEKCIREYYDPVSEHYRAALAELRDPHDIADTDFGKYESYGPLCLSNPDEVWMDTSEHGENFYYYMGHYSNEAGKFTYIVMCFCLELEPTYILMAFPTRDKKLVAGFRRGKKVDLEEAEMSEAGEAEITNPLQENMLANQGKALEEEMLRHRGKDDIPAAEFEDFSHFLEQTIENPDEVWELEDAKAAPILTLISQPEEGTYYIVICTFEPGAGEDAQQSWRVIFNFPTRDQSLVQRYRRGAIREGSDGTTTKFLH
jgi:hypothetical protein